MNRSIGDWNLDGLSERRSGQYTELVWLCKNKIAKRRVRRKRKKRIKREHITHHHACKTKEVFACERVENARKCDKMPLKG